MQLGRRRLLAGVGAGIGATVASTRSARAATAGAVIQSGFATVPAGRSGIRVVPPGGVTAGSKAFAMLQDPFPGPGNFARFVSEAIPDPGDGTVRINLNAKTDIERRLAWMLLD